MSREYNIGAAVTHILLCGVSGHSLSKYSDEASFTHLGMHANFFIHGVVGFLHRGRFVDMGAAYKVSLQATKYFALPCLMADLYRAEKEISALHLVSGLIPFALALAQEDESDIGKVVIALNITSLCYYSYKNKQDWGWYTAGAALLAYFIRSAEYKDTGKMLYPVWLALMEHCSYRVHRVFGLIM